MFASCDKRIGVCVDVMLHDAVGRETLLFVCVMKKERDMRERERELLFYSAFGFNNPSTTLGW